MLRVGIFCNIEMKLMANEIDAVLKSVHTHAHSKRETKLMVVVSCFHQKFGGWRVSNNWPFGVNSKLTEIQNRQNTHSIIYDAMCKCVCWCSSSNFGLALNRCVSNALCIHTGAQRRWDANKIYIIHTWCRWFTRAKKSCRCTNKSFELSLSFFSCFLSFSIFLTPLHTNT